METQKIFPWACLLAGLVMGPSTSQAALLNLAPDVPTINFGGGGMIKYDQNTNTVTVSADPTTLFSTTPFIVGEILGTGTEDVKDVTIKFQVNSSGQVVPNDTNVADLTITGSIDTDADGTADFTGTLLTAEVTQFGFLNGASGGDDSFDIRLNNIGGALSYLYTGQDLAVSVTSETTSEYTSPFAGNFTSNWQGQAKGVIGTVDPVSSGGSCKLKLKAQCSVNGAPFTDKCRIKVSRSPKHWERCDYSHNGNIFHKSKYGMHGDPVPAWAGNYPSTAVTFKYTVYNKGVNPVSGIVIEDSFDTPVTGYPSSLAVGANFSTTRTINLHEGIDNDVTVLGNYGSAMCGDDDVVVVKDKIRGRRDHDDDDFWDKGHH